MKRPRHKLEVSTFPFLAVLLCAMGALILLLLVIDKRGKAVARAKARQSVAQQREEIERRAREKQLALEEAAHERKAQRQALIDAEKAELDRRLADLLRRVAESSGTLEQRGQLSKEIAAQFGHAQSQLLLNEKQLAGERFKLGTGVKLTEQAKAELQRQTSELKQLEAALVGLRVMRQREQQTYSLVPYRGKRGDNRKPIYVECNLLSLVFHPDGLKLEGAALTESRVRQEVIARMTRQKAELVHEKKAENRAYLLLLVRPDGINNYYGLQAAVTGLPVDFGYEFVDANWILDFNEDGDRQPWQKAAVAQEGALTLPPLGTTPSFEGRPRPAVPGGGNGNGGGNGGGWPPSPNGGNGPPGSGSVLGTGQPGNGKGGVPGLGGGGPPSTNGGSGGYNAGGSAVTQHPGPPPNGFASGPGSGGSPPSSNGEIGVGSGSGNAFRPGSPTGASPWKPAGSGGSPSPNGGNGTAGTGDGRPGSPSQVVTGKAGGGAGSPSPNGGNGGNGATGTGGGGAGSPSEGVAGKAGGPAGSPSPNGQFGTAGTNAAHPGSPPEVRLGKPGEGGGSPSANGENGSAGSGNSTPSAPSTGGTTGRPGSGGGQPSGNGENGGQPGGSGELGGGSALPPSVFREPGKGSPPTPIGRLLGNRDWIIGLECKEDELFLRNTGQRFPVRTEAERQVVEQALARTISAMVTRRQATVRAGDPPYRPNIRLYVHAEGQRTYYFAYPLLQSLGLQMSRENVLPELKPNGPR